MEVRFSPGAYLRVVDNAPDLADTRIAVPEIRARDLSGTTGMAEINNAEQYGAGHTIMNVHDLPTGHLLWFVAPTSLLPAPPAIVRACGRVSLGVRSTTQAVFYADSVQSAPAP